MNAFERTGYLAFCLLISIPCGRASEVVKVAIGDLAFAPADIKAHVGDTIEWHNGDFIDHTATDKGGAWDVTIASGTSAKVLLSTAGTFHYFCRFNPGMTGMIKVEPAQPPK